MIAPHDVLFLLRRQLAGWDAEMTPPKALVVPNFQRNGHGCRTSEDAKACRAAFEGGEIAMPSGFAQLQECMTSKVHLL